MTRALLYTLAAIVSTVFMSCATSGNYRTMSGGFTGEARTVTGRFVLDSSSFEIVNLGPKINTDMDDYSPAISAGGLKLYFVGVLPSGTGNHDLFVTTRPSREALNFDQPTNVGPPVNTPRNEGNVGLSRNSETIYFTKCDGLDCNIYEWLPGTPVLLPVDAINSRHWETTPALSFDGETLYFASSRPGGSDGSDLFMSKRKRGGGWEEPVRLPRTVNSPDREEGPALVDGDSLLFFSSDRDGGYGGFDLYVSRRAADGTWGVPINLGPEFNTPADERGISVTGDGREIYFSSSRADMPHGGRLDIYVARRAIAAPRRGF